MSQSEPAEVHLLFVGHVSVDDIHGPDGAVYTHVLGGAALYANLGATLWPDVRTQVVSRIGTDLDQAQLRVAACESANTDFAGVSQVDGPSIRAVLRHFADGSRDVIFDDAARIDPLTPGVADLPPLGTGTNSVHLTPAPLAVQRDLARAVSRRGVPVSVDTELHYLSDGATLDELLRSVDVFIPSIEHVQHLFGTSSGDPRSAWRPLCELGPPIVVVKCGADGAVAFDVKNRRSLAVPPLPGVRVCDSTGAGDAFSGGFLAGLYREGDIASALAHGTVSASFALGSIGATCPPDATKSERTRRLETLREAAEHERWVTHA